MTHIRNAQGNNLTEILSDTINQVSGQFIEGVNAMFSGFKTFSQSISTQGFAPNGQQQTSHNTSHNTHIRLGGPPTADEIHAGMESSERVMQAQEVDFFGGPEDTRAVSQIKQVGAQ